jgi:hypothetical protein
MSFPFPGIGILFDIDKLGGGYYGYKAWQIFMRHVSSDELPACILVEGDTLAERGPLANLFCIGIYGLTTDLRKIRERFEELDEPGLAAMPARTVEKAVLDNLPLPTRSSIDAFGRMTADRWTRVDHDLCWESGWAYAPSQVPPDLDENLRVQLHKMKTERPMEMITRGRHASLPEKSEPAAVPAAAPMPSQQPDRRRRWPFWKRD